MRSRRCIRFAICPAYLGRSIWHGGRRHAVRLRIESGLRGFQPRDRVCDAGGLGLPDRDYYTKTDAKSQETRQKYVEHVQHMFELLGERRRWRRRMPRP
jgi:predicted metalloendopeptidase